MFSKVFLLVVTVFIISAFAEPPVQNNQNQEEFGPYQSSGWRPAGPAFRLPERPPLPITFYNSPPETYVAPQRGFSTSENNNRVGKNLEQERSTFERQVDLTYNTPQESNQFQKEKYVSRTNIRFNQPTSTNEFFKRNQETQNVGRENQGDLTNNVPQETLSAPGNQPAVTYGPPTEGTTSELPPEGSGNGETQEQDDLKYRVIKPNSQRGGIEYQVDLTYGAPQETLVAPPNQPAVTYGPPQEETSTTAQPESTTTELPTTTESVTEETTEDKDENNEPEEENVVKKENLKEEVDQVNEEQSVYYIYHPTGLLQRVTYSGKDDQTNMAYSARLKYENIEPLQGPVYTYDPETFVFKRLY